MPKPGPSAQASPHLPTAPLVDLWSNVICSNAPPYLELTGALALHQLRIFGSVSVVPGLSE